MPFKIGIRTTPNKSVFRSYLSDLISAPVDRAHDQLVLASSYWKQSIINTQPPNTLADLVKRHCSDVYTIGDAGTAYPSATHLSDYQSFLRRFINSVAPVRVTYGVATGAATHYWHAKISLRLEDKHVVAALIGSSNMTTRPYEAPPILQFNPTGIFNMESDVLMWLDRPNLNAHFFGLRSSADMAEHGTFEVFGSELAPGTANVPARLPLNHQLDAIAALLRRHVSTLPWTV